MQQQRQLRAGNLPPRKDPFKPDAIKQREEHEATKKVLKDQGDDLPDMYRTLNTFNPKVSNRSANVTLP